MDEPVTERLFLGVELSDEVRHGLAEFLARETGRLPGKAVPPPNWHITLRFLGATDETTRDLLLMDLEDALLPAAFTVGFGGLGAFPRRSRANVLFLGVDRGADQLTELGVICEEAARHVGFEANERRFHPHLTLARIRPAEDVATLVEKVPVFPLTQAVDRATLYRSILGRGGARYEVVDEVEL